jgi:very-short-patch-repair endonuclease
MDGRVRRGEWVAVDHGVYRAAETPPSWRQRLIAACLAGPAVASHRSAAALWGFPDFTEDIVEVTSVRHRRRKSDDVIWHESVRLDEREVTAIDSIAVTSATRTVIDLGAVLDLEDLLKALDDVLRRRLASVESIARDLESLGPQRVGSGRVRRALALRKGTPVPESPPETEFDSLVRRFDLPQPCRQWRVRSERGKLLARVDFAYPVARLAIEVDSARWHGAAPDQARDERRDRELRRLGWKVLRFAVRDIRRRPEWVRDQILVALASPDASLDPRQDGERRNQ